MTESRDDASEILSRLRSGGEPEDTKDTERLFRLLYAKLRELAAGMLANERAGHTLQPTALVHEAYLRFVDGAPVEWRDRKHFMTVAARAMRHVLVDHGRRRAAAKRGGGWQRVVVAGELGEEIFPDTDVFDLSLALSRLDELDTELSSIVELRVFAGLTVQEIAELHDVTRRTIHNHWRVAIMWLRRELADGRLA